jgi:hypothetical protein
LVCYDVCLHIDAFKSFPVYWVFLVWVGDKKPLVVETIGGECRTSSSRVGLDSASPVSIFFGFHGGA